MSDLSSNKDQKQLDRQTDKQVIVWCCLKSLLAATSYFNMNHFLQCLATDGRASGTQTELNYVVNPFPFANQLSASH